MIKNRQHPLCIRNFIFFLPKLASESVSCYVVQAGWSGTLIPCVSTSQALGLQACLPSLCPWNTANTSFAITVDEMIPATVGHSPSPRNPALTSLAPPTPLALSYLCSCLKLCLDSLMTIILLSQRQCVAYTCNFYL